MYIYYVEKKNKYVFAYQFNFAAASEHLKGKIFSYNNYVNLLSTQCHMFSCIQK